MILTTSTLTPAIHGCNAVTRDCIRALNRSQSIISFSMNQRNNNSVLRSSTCQKVASVMAVTGKHPNGVTVGLMESAENERVQLERLRDDGSSYKERFTIRCYEVGFNKTATIETIADLLQGRSCVDALVGHDPPMKICNNVLLYILQVYILEGTV
ncbi:acyl-ACP thioesterase [Tanacetum coccineum]|uniref:Acyl-ACP thioesterase n=1 Tax=Tanacetum coccineum TaxID=301880 RepID=A0ABQ5BTV7_9ASTR